MAQRLRPLRRYALALGLALVVLLAARPALAAPSLMGGAAEIEVEGTQARVRVHYRLQNDDANTTILPLTVLRMAGTTIVDLRVRTPGGEELPADVAENGPALNVQVPIPEPPGPEFEVVVEYRVQGAVSDLGSDMRQVIAPILAPKWGPAGQSTVFEARVHVSGRSNFVEGFPVSPEGIQPGDGTTTLVYRTPVVPGMIRAVVTEGVVPFWTLQRTLDVGVMLVLAVGALATYFAVVRRPRSVVDRTAI